LFDHGDLALQTLDALIPLDLGHRKNRFLSRKTRLVD